MPFSLFRRKTTTYDGPVPVFDELSTIPEFASVAAALSVGNWTGVEDGLVALPVDEAEYAMFLAAQAPEHQPFLEAAVVADPQSLWARTTLALRFVFTGWEIRTDSRAEDVSREQWAGLHSWAARAEQLLTEVLADDPDFAPAWYVRMLSARAVEVAPSELDRRARAHARLAPGDLTALQQGLQFHLPKWFGSDDVATAFARDAAAECAPGSSGLAIVALRHLDRWADIGGEALGFQYLNAPAVRDELIAASTAFRAGAVGLRPVQVQAHSAFLMALALGEHFEPARAHLDALGTRASAWPWTLAFGSGADLVGLYALVLGNTGGVDQR
jgi:hypothetical protein